MTTIPPSYSKELPKDSMLEAKELYNQPSFDSVAVLEVSQAQQKFERKTMLWVDFRMLPLMSLLYSFALIDRINLGSARAAGMEEDLNLKIGSRYSIATCLYFVPYVLLQLPGNLVLRKVGVRNWLACMVVGWGAVQLGMGFVPTWGYLTLCRILLGMFEAPFFPALAFIIATWYRRHEVQKRLSAFYLMSITIGGFSPILAYGFSLLNGKRGIRGWRWIFIIEGAITLFLGVLTWFFVPDFPDRNKFLTPEQTALVLKRVEDDRGDSIPDTLTFRKVVTHLGDWTLWCYGIMLMCATLPAYALAFFISLILKGMGWSTSAALLLSAPPYGPAVITVMLFSWLSDKYKHRGAFIIIQTLICTVGLVLMAFAKGNNVRYFGTFLVNAGNSGTIPGILAYASNNVVSQSKRSVQSAITISFGGIGGILASTVFREKDAPAYVPGLVITITLQGVLIVTYLATFIHHQRLNRLSRAGKLSAPLEGQIGFFYTL